MKAIRFDRFGGPEELNLVEMPDPEPGPDDVLIAVHAVSVVPGDWKLRKGLLTAIFAVEPPKVPERDGAGIVRAVGENVSEFAPEGRVCFTCQQVEQGSYAELACRPQREVVAMPDNLNFVEAAAVMHAGVCAYTAVVETAAIKAGDRVLVHGAAGAISGMAVQICKDLGATVTGTCRAKNVDHIRALGAYKAIAYDETDFAELAADQDVVIDLVGGEALKRSYGVLRPGGLIVWLIAAPFEDRSDDFNVEVRQAMIRDDQETLKAVVDLAAAGRIQPLVSRVLPLEQAAQAHRLLEAGENSRGRLVLQVGASVEGAAA